MKKLLLALTAASMCLALLGHPGPGPHPRPVPHGPRIHHAPPPPPPRAPYYHHHHHSSGPFWTGLGIGLLGSLVLPPPPPPPTVVVSTPVVQLTPQRVWVPPVYGERAVYRAGVFIGMERYVITPGYWTTTY